MNDQQKQNNLITQIVVGVIAVIVCCVVYFNRPVPVAQADPTKVQIVQVKVPENLVQKTPGLPSGSDNNQPGAPGASPAGSGGAAAGPTRGAATSRG